MAHRVELLVIAAEFTGVVTAGCDLGAQREHQHADGGQPHEDTPGGRGKGKRRRQGPTSVDPTLRNIATFRASKPELHSFCWEADGRKLT